MSRVKRCRVCGEWKPAVAPDFFYRDRGNRDGLGNRCSVCTRVWREKRRAEVSAPDGPVRVACVSVEAERLRREAVRLRDVDPAEASRLAARAWDMSTRWEPR